MIDPRQGNAEYYDLDATPLPDIPFYMEQVNHDMSVLELGCGTGRVLIPLAAKCKGITGVDSSPGMIERCKAKLKEGKIAASAMVGDITNLRLTQKFDLILAPYRVMQALATDAELDGFCATIRTLLKPEGKCILNVFQPNRPREEMMKSWVNTAEVERWRKTLSDGTSVVHSVIYRSIQEDPLVIFPELIYRKYRGLDLIDEHVLKIKMRCFYPQEFSAFIARQGFKILHQWGGYRGETYGQGPELVVKFGLDR